MLAIAAMISAARTCAPLATIAAGRTASAIELDTADAAAGRARDMPPSLVDALGLRRRQPHPQLDAVVELHDIERVDLVGRLHDALAEAEPDGKILQVLRRAHHDGIGAAIIGQRNRGLLRNQACAFTKMTVAPDLPIGGM